MLQCGAKLALNIVNNSRGQVMNLLSSKKAIFTILSLGTVVFAGTMKDISSRTVEKAHKTVSQAPVERYIASNEQEVAQAAMMRVDMNETHRINAKWEITRIIAANEVVTFDKLNNVDDQNKSIIVPFKLVSPTKVMINNDNGLVYNISLLSNYGTIAIFKQMGSGFEIIEAKMIKESTEASESIEEEVELFLERALNSSKSNKVLTGSDAIGEMLLTKESIESLRITLTNTNGTVQNIDVPSVELKAGGTFTVEVDGEEATGVIFANGKEGYRLNFVTGPLAGAMLNFMTKSQKDMVDAQNNELNDNYYEEERENAEVAIEEVQVLQDRNIANENIFYDQELVVLSQEEIKEITENQGFAF